MEILVIRDNHGRILGATLDPKIAKQIEKDADYELGCQGSLSVVSTVAVEADKLHLSL